MVNSIHVSLIFLKRPIDINRYFDITDDSREITKEEYQEREKHFVNQEHEKFVIA